MYVLVTFHSAKWTWKLQIRLFQSRFFAHFKPDSNSAVPFKRAELRFKSCLSSPATCLTWRTPRASCVARSRSWRSAARTSTAPPPSRTRMTTSSGTTKTGPWPTGEKSTTWGCQKCFLKVETLLILRLRSNLICFKIVKFWRLKLFAWSTQHATCMIILFLPRKQF